MKTTGNTVLITGGGTGIGLALAEAFCEAGNEILICGRRRNRLDAARRRLPKLHAFRCDVTDPSQRRALFDWATKRFPDVNILINNAGIQREIDFTTARRLRGREDEIETNLRAPIQLAALFIPHLMKRRQAAIINISSGLGFIPIAVMPVYCATKAAIHSFSLSLRHQLKETAVRVFEIIPPMVDTELDKGARGRRGGEERGIKPKVAALATLRALEKNQYELAVGQAESLRMGARKNPEQLFRMMNGA
ncbi:MAG: SDR family oxidoreductase [Planctomycetota bacterium]